MTTPSISNIAIIGAGSWGTALAIHLAAKGQPVTLYSNSEQQLQQLAQDRSNEAFLPGIAFPQDLQLANTTDLTAITQPLIVVAVPSAAFTNVMTQLAAIKPKLNRLVWATKGLDMAAGGFLQDIVRKHLGHHIAYGVLSGPSFAKEVAQQLPTAVVFAGNDEALTDQMANIFQSAYFRVYKSRDLIGVQLGGAIKNVMAIAVGIADGLGYGANARSALITRGLAEMMRLGEALGAQPQTLTGLAGLGDLILTCTDNQSRNRRFGIALGQGATIADAIASVGQVVEGVPTAKQLLTLADGYSITMPITVMVNKILEGAVTPVEAVMHLLQRETKAEF